MPSSWSRLKHISLCVVWVERRWRRCKYSGLGNCKIDKAFLFANKRFTLLKLISESLELFANGGFRNYSNRKQKQPQTVLDSLGTMDISRVIDLYRRIYSKKGLLALQLNLIFFWWQNLIDSSSQSKEVLHTFSQVSLVDSFSTELKVCWKITIAIVM